MDRPSSSVVRRVPMPPHGTLDEKLTSGKSLHGLGTGLRAQVPWASGPSRCEIAPSALLDCERMSTCLLATPLFLVKTDERQHVPVLYLHSLSVHRNPVQLANMLAGVYVVTPYSTKIVTLYCRLLYPVQTAPSNPVLADWSVPQVRSRYRGGRGWPSASVILVGTLS